MKRQLLDFYRTAVPDPVKNAVPPQAKAWGLGLLFALTRSPDLRLWQMRHLFKVYQDSGRPPPFDDPLFRCTITPAPSTVRDGAPEPLGGTFFAEFGFHGLKLQGRYRPGSLDRQETQAEWADILLDGQCLRREKPRVVKGRAGFLYTVRRPALAMFPPGGRIEVRDSLGRAFAVDPCALRGRHRATHCLALDLGIPYGSGEIFSRLQLTGPLDKKGWPRPSESELGARQDGMLALYDRVRTVFEQELGKPLFLMYGTLLGQHRGGDFIPGDDDFDVGYVSECNTPDTVKVEAIQIIEALVANGFTVLLNHLGRPFRVRDGESGVDLHLDSHVLFTAEDGYVWCHPRAHLPLPLDGFRMVENGMLRGIPILKPAATEAFLAAYYGPNWRIPDPDYGNIIVAGDQRVARGLGAVCLTRAEQRALLKRIERRNLPGEFIPMALHDPYPLERYQARIGF